MVNRKIYKYVLVLLVIAGMFLGGFRLISYHKQLSTNEPIQIESPIVVSHNSVMLKDGSYVYVNIEMTKGRYFFETLGGGFYGGNWNGEYQIRVYREENEYDSPMSVTPLNIGNETLLNFGSLFNLEFDDYNNDGNPDFTIGQWGSSNGNTFEMFSIDNEGNIIDLNTNIFVSDHSFSILLEKTSPTSFTYSYYNNMESSWIQCNYEWMEDSFIKIE